MTDRTLTPEVYGDFGLFMEQMGQIGRASCRERVCLYV